MVEVEVRGKRDIYIVHVTKDDTGHISEVYNSSGRLVWTQIDNTPEKDVVVIAEDAVEFYEEVEEDM